MGKLNVRLAISIAGLCGALVRKIICNQLGFYDNKGFVYSDEVQH